jgi:hypothetical protein
MVHSVIAPLATSLGLSLLLGIPSQIGLRPVFASLLALVAMLGIASAIRSASEAAHGVLYRPLVLADLGIGLWLVFGGSLALTIGAILSVIAIGWSQRLQ